MNVLLFLSVAVFVLRPGDVTGQLITAPPTCPGDTFTFRCTVGGDINGFTTWRVGGGSECTLVHRSTSSSICGLGDTFTARSGTGFGTSGPTNSTLSGTAISTLNGTLVECFGPANDVDPENMVGNSTLQILGPPSVPTVSCVALSEDVSGTVNVTVSWTLSGGGSADFYLTSIATNAPQTPYGGLLNITTGSVTQHELTGFMADYEYNITVRGVNCGSQEGRESESLTIRPQVPAVVSHCNITVAYDHPPERLLFINTTWDSMPDPVDPDPGEVCAPPRANIKQYQISFQANFSVNVSISDCTAGKCSYFFEPPSNPPSSYDSVSVAAENVVGVGAARSCTTQTISTTNNLLAGGIVDVSSPSDAQLQCTFLPGFTGSAHCTVQYGTDPTYMNLPYSAESIETGTAGDTVSVVLRERLNSTTDYYYTVSAVSGDVTVVMRGTFITPPYSCFMIELWDLPAAGVTFLSDVSSLGDAAIRYPSCVNGSVRSAVLNDTTLDTATVAYYSGNTPGSTACFVCDENSVYELNTTINERVCQSNVTWSGSPTVCVCNQPQLLGWHIALIVMGATFLTFNLILVAIIVVCNCWKNMTGEPPTNLTCQGKDIPVGCLQYLYRQCKLTFWQTQFLIVITVIFVLIEVALWMAVGAVVSHVYPNGNVCNPSWHSMRDGLIIAECVASIFVLVLTMFLAKILCFRTQNLKNQMQQHQGDPILDEAGVNRFHGTPTGVASDKQKEKEFKDGPEVTNPNGAQEERDVSEPIAPPGDPQSAGPPTQGEVEGD